MGLGKVVVGIIMLVVVMITIISLTSAVFARPLPICFR